MKKQQSQHTVIQLKHKRTYLVIAGIVFSFIIFSFFRVNLWGTDHAGLYHQGTFEEALRLAENQDRLCFVKFYTDFCYPCDKADQKILSDKKVYSILNENYISFSIDAFDQLNGGMELADKFNINSFPTILITDWEGNELERWTQLPEAGEIEHILEKSNALRTAPGNIIRTGDNSPKPSTRRLQNSEIEDIKSEALKKDPEFGLVVMNDDSYRGSRKSANKMTREWNRGVWIHPSGKTTYQTVIGPFQSKEEAKTTQSYLKLWEGKKAGLVRLSENPVKYHLKD